MNDNPATLLCSLPMAAVGRVFCFHPPSGKGTESGNALPSKYKNRRSMPWKAGKKEDFGIFGLNCADLLLLLPVNYDILKVKR